MWVFMAILVLPFSIWLGDAQADFWPQEQRRYDMILNNSCHIKHLQLSSILGKSYRVDSLRFYRSIDFFFLEKQIPKCLQSNDEEFLMIIQSVSILVC